jgi:hypothetical protein
MVDQFGSSAGEAAVLTYAAMLSNNFGPLFGG